MTIRAMTNDEVFVFVEGLLNGDVYTSQQVPEHLVPLVFMPIGFSTEKIDPDVGLVWANIKTDQTMGNRCINGYPMFASCRLMLKADLLRCHSAFTALQEARAKVKETLSEAH